MTDERHFEGEAAAADRGLEQFGDGRLHIVIGKTQEEWDALMAEARASGTGVPVSNDPDYHAHPALGITGHLHPPRNAGRRPHTHRPITSWDTTPLFTDAPDGPVWFEGDCQLGLTVAQAQERVGDRWEDFERWMRGQTVGYCDGRVYDHEKKEYQPSGCGPHGTVFYAHDVDNFLGGGRAFD